MVVVGGGSASASAVCVLIFPSLRVSRVATSSKRFRCAFAGANLVRKASVFLVVVVVVVVGVVLVLSARWYNAPVLLGVGGGVSSPLKVTDRWERR